MGLVEFLSSVRADRKIKKLLRHAAPYSLAAFPEATFGRVIGTVQPHRSRVLEAPLSGRLCAYYSIAVRAHVVSWRTRREPYTTIAEEQEAVPFELHADGDRAVIDPKDAWISSGFDHKSDDLFDPRVQRLIGRMGIVVAPLLIQEAVLELDERIAVFGAAVREPDPGSVSGEAGYRDGVPLRLRFTGTAKFPLVIRDDIS